MVRDTKKEDIKIENIKKENVQKLEMIKQNTIEIINENELEELLKQSKQPVVYCGYETSGKIHLGHLVTITKLIDFMKIGFKVKILFADWHTWLNRKGDWDFIHKQVGDWKRGFKAAGLEGENVEYVLGSNFQRKIEYIDDVFRLALNTTLKRALRSMQQIGRDIENARVSQVLYPLMQVSDIKHLKVDIAYGGIEQRKIHMLAREYIKDINYKIPICIHTPLIPSLAGKGKMSSSIEESMISIDDDLDIIKHKLKKAFCPEGIVENNAILAISKLVIMPRVKGFEVKRASKYGGNVCYKTYNELEKDFIEKKLFPLDLKMAVADYLDDILSKIRNAMQLK